MSLDDQDMPWPAAEALERGQNPERVPEFAAAERLASLVGTYLTPAWLTTLALEEVCRKVIAHRASVRSMFDELDADPKRIGERGEVLKQQRAQGISEREKVEEALYYAKRDVADLEAALRVIPRDGFDPDAREQDRENDRLRERRQDEHANREAVRP